MTVVFDAEPLLAFAFDEPGADEVSRWLDRVYDGDCDGYVSTINLAEFRYVAARKTSADRADAHIDDLRQIRVMEYDIDGLWKRAAEIEAEYNTAIGDAYALAAATDLDSREDSVTLLIGADDDYDALDEDTAPAHLIERFREPA